MGRLDRIGMLPPQAPPCPHYVAQAVRGASAVQRAAGFEPVTSPLDGQIPPYNVRRRETWLLELLDLAGVAKIRVNPIVPSGWDDELDLPTIAALSAEPLAAIDARAQLWCREFATDRLCQARVYRNPRSGYAVTTYYDYSTGLFFNSDGYPFASRAALEAAHGFDASWRWSSYHLYASYGRLLDFRSPVRMPILWEPEHSRMTYMANHGVQRPLQCTRHSVRTMSQMLTILGYQSRQRLRSLLADAHQRGMQFESGDVATMKATRWPGDRYAFEWHKSHSHPGLVNICLVTERREMVAAVLDFRSQQTLVDYVFATLDIADALARRNERRIVVRMPERIGYHWIVRQPVPQDLCRVWSYDRERVGAFLAELANEYRNMSDPALRIVEECIRLARAEYDGYYSHPRTANGVLDNVAIRWNGSTGQFEFVIYNPM